jgi:hypothetical protein
MSQRARLEQHADVALAMRCISNDAGQVPDNGNILHEEDDDNEDDGGGGRGCGDDDDDDDDDNDDDNAKGEVTY